MDEHEFSDLTEGFSDTEKTELGPLDNVHDQLAAYDLPDPTPQEMALLMAKLKPVLNARAEAIPAPVPQQKRSVLDWMRLVWAQTSLLDTSFWWASMMVFVFGTLVIALNPTGWLTLILLLIAPVLTAVSVALVFRTTMTGLWELEQVSVRNPIELLYARLALVLAYNTLFLFVLSVFIQLQVPQVIFWRLLLVWFGPMLMLAGMAVYASVRLGIYASIILPMSLWFLLLLLGWQRIVAERIPMNVPPMFWLAQFSQSSVMLTGTLVTLLIGIVCLWLAARTVSSEEFA